MEQALTVIVDGIIYSAWLFVAAIGLTLIYGVMKIVNLTHGSCYALGAYAAASFTGTWLARGYPPMLSYAVLLGSAVVISLVFAPLIERAYHAFDARAVVRELRTGRLPESWQWPRRLKVGVKAGIARLSALWRL